MSRSTVACVLIGGVLSIAACNPSQARRARSSAIEGTGHTARALLSDRRLDWRVLETNHTRIHAPARSFAFDRASSLGDSIEAARTVALAALDEKEVRGEPKIEVFLVDSREEMRRIAGRPIAGFAQPGELTAVFIAGKGYKPAFKHELNHAYAFVRWGELRGGTWITEGLANLAAQPCQGHSADAIAAGYLSQGKLPTVAAMRGDFRGIPELEGYTAAASLLDFIRRRYGISTVRALWQGNAADSIAVDLNKHGGGNIESAWRSALQEVTPATLDSLRLMREGC